MSYIDINRVQHCTNCGLTGHIFRNCLAPVTSYGIIALRYITNDKSILHTNTNHIINNINSIEFLLIQRKDSLSFVEFIRGKYNVSDKEYITRLVKNMTISEQKLLQEMTFDELWKNIWGDNSSVKSHKNDYETSEKKFAQIHEELQEIIKENPSKWDEPEWGFPKGRRNPHETDISCAIREFLEETALKKSDFSVIQNIYPISETFFGSNQIHYCHKYYIAICNSDIKVEMNMENPHMAREIGAIKWCSLDEAITKIRPDNVEKREILLKAGKIIRNFYPVDINEPSKIIHMNHRHTA
jgi:8-oxo-dGTP pyrophosphatase MutT (NUDIX family)